MKLNKPIENKISLLLILTASIFIFYSCEDPVEVNIPQGETLFVVDAFLNDQQQIQKVKLSTTSPYFSNLNVPAVTGAVVNLSDITSGKNYSFNDLGNGEYVFSPAPSDSFGMVGNSYKLEVNWNGHGYYAVSKLNRTSPVDTIIFVKQEGGQGFNAGYYPYIYAFDQDNGKDYYWLKAYKNGNYINNPLNLNVVEDAGGDQTDGLAFIPPNAFFNVTPADDPYEIENFSGQPDLCTIACYSINKNTFDFLVQAQVQMTNSSSGLFATAPENVRTNIIPVGNAPKAIGWFNIGAIKSKTLMVQ